MKNIIKFFLVVLTLVLITGCGNGDSTDGINKESSNSKKSEKENISESKKTDQQVLQVGETGEFISDLGNFIVTLSSVKTSEGEGEETPYGDLFLIAEIEVENRADKRLNVEETIPFEVYDEDGMYWYRSEDLTFIDNIQGEFDPGETIKGEIVFDVDLSDSYMLILGNSTYSNEVIWGITDN